jgi:hypothetical protein
MTADTVQLTTKSFFGCLPSVAKRHQSSVVTSSAVTRDRYANMETNYLGQRVEVCGGLVVLTTNRKS